MLSVLIWSQAQTAGLDLQMIVIKLILTYALIVVSVVDWEFYIIPNEITYAGFVMGLIFAVISPQHLGMHHSGQALLYSLFGACIGAGSLWLIGWIAKVFMKKEAMGLGDVKLMGMVGAWLGWKAAIGSIMLASVLGAVIGICFVMMRKLYLESRLAFGPFLSIGVFVFMMWGDSLLAWYSKLLYSVGCSMHGLVYVGFRISDFEFCL
jgi:leader peptidase (prepilin peptidase)/N-methyltransferase